MGTMRGRTMNVHGAGAQRSDPKSGDPKDPRWAGGMGPQGDEIRILNYQEVPQPGLPGLGSARSAAEYGYASGTILGSSGHLRVAVSESEVKAEYVRAFMPKDENEQQKNGQVGYVYAVQARSETRKAAALPR